MTISRMELSELRDVDEIAAALIVQIGDYKPPTQIEVICRELDIERIEDVPLEGFEGALICEPERPTGVILVKSGSISSRRRFTISHELGHFLCDWHAPNSSNGFYCTTTDIFGETSSRETNVETEANRFAANILVPPKIFQANLSRRALDLNVIVELAQKYEVSKEVIARRVAELHHEPCALVLAKSGSIERLYRSKDFPWIDLAKGSQLPKHIRTSIFGVPNGRASSWREMDGSVWLNASVRNPRSIAEQVLQQQEGWQMILLTLGDNPSEVDEDESDDEDERYLRSDRYNRRWSR